MSNDYPKKAASHGVVRISENVIRSIAAVAAKEIDGISGLAEKRNGIAGLFCPSEPVKVQVVNDMIEITVRVILEEGVRLMNVAEQVQQNIKSNIQNMTGVIVSKVHVIAVGIAFDA
ncbi:MAG: Asp23/Gls24 family envelope stress response protein [Oscillospiraceae bacterium]|nr:Asp23/Gls24 family envelope stress response protein [Oscillospiraceae bacterium]